MASPSQDGLFLFDLDGAGRTRRRRAGRPAPRAPRRDGRGWSGFHSRSDSPMSVDLVPEVVYEQPLNERMRGFMRLEFLFARAERLLEATDAWSSRAALEAIIDVMTVMGRSVFSRIVKQGIFK